jgi:membrane protease YdiL (CAAX protease family)
MSEPLLRIFIGEDRRLRGGWRILLLLAAQVAVSFAIAICFAVVIIVHHRLTGGGRVTAEELQAKVEAPSVLMLMHAASFTFILPVIIYFRRALDRRTFRSLGFGSARREPALWAIGAVCGAFLVGTQVVMASIWGDVASAGPSDLGGRAAIIWGGTLLFFLVQTLSEELLFRGYIQSNLAEGIGPFGAILFTALFFSSVHNFNWNLGEVRTIGLTNIFLAGVLLGIVYHRTGSLPAVWGLHFGWNVFLGPVFGLPVSGFGFQGVFPLRIEVSPSLGGGAFGLEGGLLCTPVLLAAIGVFWVLSRRRPDPLEEWERAAAPGGS